MSDLLLALSAHCSFHFARVVRVPQRAGRYLRPRASRVSAAALRGIPCVLEQQSALERSRCGLEAKRMRSEQIECRERQRRSAVRSSN